jgi:MFS family permease
VRTATPDSHAQQLDHLYSRVTRHTLPLLLLGYVIAYLDRVNVSFAKLQIARDLGFSDYIYGLGAGIFFLGYFVFEVPSNWALHRVGARAWIGRIMISWGTLSVATMFVHTAPQFYALRFLLGAAEAGFFPGIIYHLSQWYPAPRRAQITASFMAGVAIASVVGSLLSGWILEYFDGAHGWSGWQWLFLLEGLPAIALGGVIFHSLTDDLSRARWLTAPEKDLLAQDLQRDQGAGHAHQAFTSAFRDPRVWFACAVYFCLVTGLYGIGFWLPTLISGLWGTRPLRMGLFTSIPYAAAAIGMILISRHADRAGEWRLHAAASAAIGALGLLLSVTLHHDPVATMAVLTLATVGILAAPPLFWNLPTQYLRGGAAAAGIALINSVGNLAGFVSPYVVGWLRELSGSLDSGIWFLASVTAGGAMLLIAKGGVRSSDTLAALPARNSSSRTSVDDAS